MNALRGLLRATPRDEGFGNGRFVRNVFESAVVRQAWRLRDVTDPDVDQLRELRAEDVVVARPDDRRDPDRRDPDRRDPDRRDPNRRDPPAVPPS